MMSANICRTIAMAALALTASACSTAGDQTAVENDPVDTVERAKLNQGRIIAFTECSPCHAVGVSDSSPREETPPLRRVLLGYNKSALEMDLMEGMRVGHADMPRFSFDPRTVDALLIYLESIQDWGRAEAPAPGPVNAAGALE